MQIIRSLGDGIGTAAGVAWPTFGIVFGSLGLTISGTASILLGSFCVGIFFLVGIPIGYWTYKKHLKEAQEIQNKIDKQESILAKALSYYLLLRLKKYPLENTQSLNNASSFELTEYLKEQIQDDIFRLRAFTPELEVNLDLLLDAEKSANFLDKFVDEFKNKINTPGYTLAINAEEHLSLKKKINPIFCAHVNSKKLAYAPQVKAALIGFFSAFGSIAGCAAGTFGFLAGIGVFAGLTAVPIAGWLALSGALIFGIIVASICAYSVYTMNKKEQLAQSYKTTNQHLEKITSQKFTIKAPPSPKGRTLPPLKKRAQRLRKSNSVDFGIFHKPPQSGLDMRKINFHPIRKSLHKFT